MNITLICADSERWALGLRSVSAVLKEAGHRTRMVFAGSINPVLDGHGGEIIKDLAAHSDLIGISSMSRSSKRAKGIIKALKPLHKPIVWGGMHPTIYPDDCVGYADLICRGEGEEFMLELAERLVSGKEFLDIRNGGYLKNGRTELNDIRPLITDLDKLPLYDFSFDDEFHLDGRGTTRPHPPTSPASSILFSGSRGCVFHCHYCSNSQLKLLYKGKGPYARKMSISRFVESARACMEKFPNARYFYFTDEDFFARTLEDYRELSEIYPERVGLPFECMASPQQITDEKMSLLVKAGMWRIDIGVESGSDRIKREIYNRPVLNKTVIKAANIVNRYPNVTSYYFFIIANPYETQADLLKTLDLLAQLPYPNFVRAYNLVFIPGTILFEKACRDGIIKGIEDSGYEIDYLAGFEYGKHAWKEKNLYLNSLVFLMAGKSTRRRLGFLPRALLPILTRPRNIDFNNRHVALSKAIVKTATVGLKIRRRIASGALQLFHNPRIVYNFKSIIKRPAARTNS